MADAGGVTLVTRGYPLYDLELEGLGSVLVSFWSSRDAMSPDAGDATKWHKRGCSEHALMTCHTCYSLYMTYTSEILPAIEQKKRNKFLLVIAEEKSHVSFAHSVFGGDHFP